MDKDEIKNIIWPTILTVILFGLFAFVVWPQTDMYKETKNAQRLHAQAYLIKTYYYGDAYHYGRERAFMMEAYNLTDEDINPQKLLRGAVNVR